jgi:hypothetical protein
MILKKWLPSALPRRRRANRGMTAFQTLNGHSLPPSWPDVMAPSGGIGPPYRTNDKRRLPRLAESSLVQGERTMVFERYCPGPEKIYGRQVANVT